MIICNITRETLESWYGFDEGKHIFVKTNENQVPKSFDNGNSSSLYDKEKKKAAESLRDSTYFYQG